MSIIFEYFFIFIKKTSIATEKKPIIAKKEGIKTESWMSQECLSWEISCPFIC
jgi:hypothetical protein